MPAIKVEWSRNTAMPYMHHKQTNQPSYLISKLFDS